MKWWMFLLIGFAVVFGFILINEGPGTNSIIQRIGMAYAVAEGFYVSGSRAQRNHNPGDLTEDITGSGIGFDGPFVIYSSDADGFSALYQLIQAQLSGKSRYYNPDMTIAEIAHIYAPVPDPGAWARTVANYLGVTVETKLSEIT